MRPALGKAARRNGQLAANSCGAARRLQEAAFHQHHRAYGAVDVAKRAGHGARVISDVGGGAACVNDGDAASQA
jgi:hypothetical protein